MNMGIHYVGENYGMEGVREYLTQYTKNVYNKTITDAKTRGLVAVEELIRGTYDKEKAPEVLSISNDGKILNVTISECPAVKYLKNELGREISPWYRYTTEIVMEVLAAECGFAFVMDSYNEENGAAAYHFAVK